MFFLFLPWERQKGKARSRLHAWIRLGTGEGNSDEFLLCAALLPKHFQFAGVIRLLYFTPWLRFLFPFPDCCYIQKLPPPPPQVSAGLVVLWAEHISQDHFAEGLLGYFAPSTKTISHAQLTSPPPFLCAQGLAPAPLQGHASPKHTNLLQCLALNELPEKP